jgi:hypothetical protein
VISISDLRAIAKARLEDAEVLAQNGQIEGAQYLYGYAVEITLKARICTTLNWSGFPETGKEFENLSNFKTHKLDVLLRLSGQESRIKAEHLWEWSAVASWDPEARYKRVGQSDLIDFVLSLEAARTLMDIL